MGIQIDKHWICDIFSREKKCGGIVEGETARVSIFKLIFIRHIAFFILLFGRLNNLKRGK